MVSRIIQVKSFDIVIFGASGDLACRKIFPALYSRFVAGQMPASANVIGAARQDMSTQVFRKFVEDCLIRHSDIVSTKDGVLEKFLSRFQYISLDVELDNNWHAIKRILREDRIRVFYLSVAPKLFEKIASKISRMGLTTKNSRIVIEKPLGKDEESSKLLNTILANYFEESQIYRIDHYLGKETVQNLMALRFSNIFFEPLWNAKFIDHVQITVAEKLGVSGRGAYYNKSGALKDMVQNHMMQLLCLTAMEPPSKFTPDMVRDEKLKVIRALGPVQKSDIVRGQYWEGVERNYRVDVGDKKSKVESYIALKVTVNNLRWAGTPFYLRTGKKMKNQISEIAIIFKELPHTIFDDKESKEQNKLVIRLQPNDGITLKTNIKDPGPGGMRITSVPLDMTFADTLGDDIHKAPDAYERLIMDVVRGDQTLFMRGDEVEEAWRWIDTISAQLALISRSPNRYAPYSKGPKAGDELLRIDGREWREI